MTLKLHNSIPKDPLHQTAVFGHSPDKDKLSASFLNLKNDAQTTEWDNHSDHL